MEYRTLGRTGVSVSQDSYLAADGIELSEDVLDRIDEIVPPGVTIDVADNMWNFGTRALEAAFRRRQATSQGTGRLRPFSTSRP